MINMNLPAHAKFLRVNMQDGRTACWFEVDLEECRMIETRTFLIVGTGQIFSEGLTYLQTFFEGPFVWHLYEDVN